MADRTPRLPPWEAGGVFPRQDSGHRAHSAPVGCGSRTTAFPSPQHRSCVIYACEKSGALLAGCTPSPRFFPRCEVRLLGGNSHVADAVDTQWRRRRVGAAVGRCPVCPGRRGFCFSSVLWNRALRFLGVGCTPEHLGTVRRVCSLACVSASMEQQPA
ncbi:hypothetical protein GN956_G19453 [Arapaima gigas]